MAQSGAGWRMVPDTAKSYTVVLSPMSNVCSELVIKLLTGKHSQMYILDSFHISK